MTVFLFLIFLAACSAAAATGALFSPGDWYRSLRKPRWTPPDFAFPIVWTVLYLAMSYAAARVGGLTVDKPAAAVALAFWALQIALNTLWTPVFFGLQRMRAGLVIILMLWVAVAATMVQFWMVDRIAGLLLLPYLVWVSIAAALNASALRLNRG